MKFTQKAALLSLSVLSISIAEPFAVKAQVTNQTQQAASAIAKATQGENTGTAVSSLKVGQQSITANADAKIMLPQNAKQAVNVTDLENPNASFKINLPTQFTGNATNSGSTAIYTGNQSSLGLQNTEEGFRALITMNSSQASHRYSFNISLPTGAHLETATQLLGKEYDTGEVFVISAQNEIIEIIDAPWAKDSTEASVPTHYEVSGNTITQVVDFNENTKFPVVADPNWKKIGNCSLQIAWVVGSTAFGAAKIMKIKKYIKALGGLGRAAELMVKCSTTAERLHYGGGALVNLVAEISGIKDLKKACF